MNPRGFIDALRALKRRETTFDDCKAVAARVGWEETQFALQVLATLDNEEADVLEAEIAARKLIGRLIDGK